MAEAVDQQEKSECNKVNKWPQILAILLVCLGPTTNGLQFAWSSPFSLVITRDKENYDLTEQDTPQFMLYQSIGMMIGSLLFYKLSDVLGRKKSVLCLAIPQIMSWLITIFAKNKWDFYGARFVAGLSDGILFCTVPPYIGEISTPSVRGVWGNITAFVLYAGQFLINVIGSFFNVQETAYICIGLPVIFFISVLFLPESPYQLIKDGNTEEAKRSIQWLQRKPNVEQDFLNMKADVDRQISESGTWMDLFKIPSNSRALRAGIFLRISQQFCGVSTFAAYTQLIFEKAGGSLNPQYSSIIYIGLVSVLNLVCSVSVEKFGRKLSYFYSLLTSAFVLLCMALYFFIDQYKLAKLEQIQWSPLAGMLTFVFTYSFGLGVVPTLMLGELFSASIKSKGLAILSASFGVGVISTTYLYHLMTAQFGMFSPFLLYSISCFISTFLTLKWVPETKGKTLEEIQQTLKQRRK